MKPRLKRFIARKNAQGRLLWLPCVVGWVRHKPFRQPPLNTIYVLRYLYAVIVKGYRVILIDNSIRNSVFYICVHQGKHGPTVVKFPRLDNRYAKLLQRSIREEKEFEVYTRLLKSLNGHPLLGHHIPRVFDVSRDGGYESEFVEGVTLSLVLAAIQKSQAIPGNINIQRLIGAVDELLEHLREYWRTGGTMNGDWAFHNLIFECSSGTIKNVDLEGFFTYGPERPEANSKIIVDELTSLKQILQLLQPTDALSLQKLMTLSAVWYSMWSGESYSGVEYVSGYHSLDLLGSNFRGQRECAMRLAAVPYEFEDRVVLDMGCNCGGMLHHLAKRIREGIGIDYNYRCINAASLVSLLNSENNVRFYTFDLDKEDLLFLNNLLFGRKVDICFLLSICMWLENWRRVIDFAALTAEALLFETNGSKFQQDEQLEYLRVRYRKVSMISDTSPDDPRQINRSLFFCTDPVKSPA